MDKLIWFLWIAVLGGVVAVLALPQGREWLSEATRACPYAMGFVKIALLGTMGDLLSGRIVLGRWRFVGIRLWQRVLVWGVFGWAFTLVFPLFSFAVDGLMDAGLLPGKGVGGALEKVLTAFFKSTLLNVLFGFGFMVFHRTTDTLIDRGRLFSVWPVVEVFSGMDWRNMFRVVGLAVLWFWIPAQTVTYLLPAEFRIMSAALLAVVLGFILGTAKRMSLASRGD